MRLRLIGALYLLIKTSMVWGAFPSIEALRYEPLKHANDLFFEINSPSLTEIIKDKKLKDSIKEMRAKLYKLQDNVAVEINSEDLLSEKSAFELRNIAKLKGKFVWQESLDSFLGNYTFQEKSGGWYSYIDETGLQDFKSLKIKFSKKILSFKLMGENSEQELDYYFSKTSWSLGRLVLSSVSSVLVENGQEIRSVSNLDYIKVRKGLWLPSRVTTSVKIKTNSLDGKVQQRSFDEIYHFSNFKINENIASNWFKSHK